MSAPITNSITPEGWNPMDDVPKDGCVIEAQCHRFSSSGTGYAVRNVQWNPIYNLWATPEENACAYTSGWHPYAWRKK